MFRVNPAETILDTEWRSPKLRAELMHLSANRLISIPHGVCGCVRVCVMTVYRLITTLNIAFLWQSCPINN